MTISSTTNRVQYSGNGSTTAFAFSYYVEDASDLSVYLTVDSTGVETLQTITTHYTVSGAGSASVTVTMVTAPASGETLTIVRDEPLTQETNVSNIGTFRSQSIETQLDRFARQTQRLWEKLGRTLHFKASSAHSDIEIPELVAGKVLKVNSSADGIELDDEVALSIGTVTTLDPGESATAEVSASGVLDFGIPQGAQGDQGDPGTDGDDGDDGLDISWEGAWQTSTGYAVNDAVENDGSAYICTSSHTSGASTEPGTGGSWESRWDLMAAKGEQGVQGDPGADGNDGGELGNVTISTSDPTGGSDGDLWFKREA